MDYTAFCIILGIAFWVLAAIAVVCLLVLSYIQFVYYKWNSQERRNNDIVRQVQEIVLEKINEIEAE